MHVPGTAQWMACFLLGVMAITVYSPVMDIWGWTKVVDGWRKAEPTRFSKHWYRKFVAKFIFWGRSYSWMLRYAIELVLPLVCLFTLGGAQPLLWLTAFASTSSGIRI